MSVEEVVSGDLSKGIVQEFREKLLADSTEEDLRPQVINDKIVYSLLCVLKLSEVEPPEMKCPLSYTIYEKKMVSVSPDPNDEVLDADCWDLPSNDASNIDLSCSLEMDRQQFLDQRQKESCDAVARETAEMDREFKSLEAENGVDSIFNLFDRRLSSDDDEGDEPKPELPLALDSDHRNAPNRLEPPREATEVAVEPPATEFAPYFDPAAHIGGTDDDAAAAQPLGNRSPSPRDAVDPQRMVNPSPYAANLGYSDVGRDPYRRYPTEYQPFRSYPMQNEYMENPAMDPSLYRQPARQSYPYSYPQDTRPGYVPNRYFNRMRPSGQPNLLQMMEESDRQQARQMLLRQQLERYEPLPPDYRQHPEMGRMNYPNYAMRMPGMDRAAMGYSGPMNYRGQMGDGMAHYANYQGNRGAEGMYTRMGNRHMDPGYGPQMYYGAGNGQEHMYNRKYM